MTVYGETVSIVCALFECKICASKCLAKYVLKYAAHRPTWHI